MLEPLPRPNPLLGGLVLHLSFLTPHVVPENVALALEGLYILMMRVSLTPLRLQDSGISSRINQPLITR